MGVRARVRTNLIYIQIHGEIPDALLQCLQAEYGPRLILKCECGETWHNVLDAPLYESEPPAMGPGAWLRFFRQDKGLSQAELGWKLGGVSRQNVSNMEYGRRPISRRMALKLSAYFGVSVDKFIG
jgi:DNA-binding XRE family transcriptional regulator